MSFFNSKEEVIDIELTQYGKVLLSRGILKPAYYSFHDDDILYDVSYAGISENTNFAEVRIQDETPVHKPFYSFKQGKPYLSNDINQEMFMSQKSNLSIEKTSLSANSLSNSTISNLYVPSWEIYNLSSDFISSSISFTNNNIISASIPQFEVEINTTFYKTNQEQIDENEKLQNLSLLETTTYNDEDIYLTVNKPLLLKVLENNTDIQDDAFELEIYKVSKDENDNDIFTQLKFLKQQDNYDSETDLYINVTDSLSTSNKIDSTYADYFFETLIDKEITNINACKYILKSSEDLDLIFNDISICDDLRDRFSTNGLYDGIPDLTTGKTC